MTQGEKIMTKAAVVFFKDITTAKQLKTRVVDGKLSVGNKMGLVNKVFTKEQVSSDQQKVEVTYTKSGKHTVTRYL